MYLFKVGQQYGDCFSLVLSVQVDELLGHCICLTELHDHFGSELTGVVIVQSTGYQFDGFSVLLHRSQRHDTNSRLKRQQLHLIVASSFWENANTLLVIQSLPYMLVQLVILKFWNHLVG